MSNSCLKLAFTPMNDPTPLVHRGSRATTGCTHRDSSALRFQGLGLGHLMKLCFRSRLAGDRPCRSPSSKRQQRASSVVSIPFIKVTKTALGDPIASYHAATSPRQMLHLIVLGAARPTSFRPPTFRPPTLSRASLRDKTQLDLEVLHAALSSNGACLMARSWQGLRPAGAPEASISARSCLWLP